MPQPVVKQVLRLLQHIQLHACCVLQAMTAILALALRKGQRLCAVLSILFMLKRTNFT